MEYSATTEGQFVFQLLAKFGLTPQEFRDMNVVDATFLVNAYNEENRRELDRMKKAEAQRRHS